MLKKFKLESQYYIIMAGLLILITILGFAVLNKMKTKDEMDNLISSSFFDIKDFTHQAIYVEPDEDTKKQMLQEQSAVDPNYTFPVFPTMPRRFNEVLKKIKPGKMSRKDVESALDELLDGKYFVTDGEEIHTGYFQFEYNQDGTLQRVYYNHTSPEGLYIGDIISKFGKPEFIYRRSPSMLNNEEYVYASKGITFFYNTPDSELDSLVIYKPQTLEEYKKNYTDIYPFWQPR